MTRRRVEVSRERALEEKLEKVREAHRAKERERNRRDAAAMRRRINDENDTSVSSRFGSRRSLSLVSYHVMLITIIMWVVTSLR
jgi:predicted neutral ceramidase superfamily lipid hydrolase